jgi:hypothetical protein
MDFEGAIENLLISNFIEKFDTHQPQVFYFIISVKLFHCFLNIVGLGLHKVVHNFFLLVFVQKGVDTI